MQIHPTSDYRNPYTSLVPPVSPSQYLSKNPEVINVELNGWCAPDVQQTLLMKDLLRRISAPKGTAIDQHLLYTDSASALDWISFCNREDYGSTVSKYDIQHMDWAAALIRQYLLSSHFDRQRLDLLFLGCGDGRQEESLTRCLLDKWQFRQLNCHLLDLSSILAMTSYKRFVNGFRHHPEVKSSFLIADFMNLPQYSDLFVDPKKENVLNVICMFGNTLSNLSNELRFVRHSLRALKKGDLFLIHTYLGFAPANKQEEIREREPLFQHISPAGNPAIEAWLRGPFERHRKDIKSIQFEYLLKHNTTSTFPNSYTMETQAIINEEARFTVLEMHRYEVDSFIGTFVQEGFKIISGQRYGYKDKRLVCLFAKE